MRKAHESYKRKVHENKYTGILIHSTVIPRLCTHHCQSNTKRSLYIHKCMPVSGLYKGPN